MAGRFNALYDETAPAIVPPPAANALAPPPSWADAATLAGQEIARQRQISADRGLWDQGGMTRAGVTDAAMQLSNMLATSTSAPGFRAYHGSPHSFEKFDTSKIGTGEGAQAYGHGLYVAENEGVAKGYRDNLSQMSPVRMEHSGLSPEAADWVANIQKYAPGIRSSDLLRQAKSWPDKGISSEISQAVAEGRITDKANPGHMYEVNVNADPAHFLDWDKPLSQQTKAQEFFGGIPGIGPETTGAEAYRMLGRGQEQELSAAMQRSGIPGIRYLDAGSRASGGTSNHVIFDANTIEILRKYGIAGLMAGGAAAATALPQQEPPT